MTGNWRKLSNEDLDNLYCSPSKSRMMKWRMMRWAGHVARMAKKKKKKNEVRV
jgi:hypothetical protein